MSCLVGVLKLQLLHLRTVQIWTSEKQSGFLKRSPNSDLDKIRVQDLANAWDLPFLTENNRRWLYEKLLIHAVLLQRITWPCEDDDEDDDYSSDTKCCMSGYLRQFITNAAPTELTNLVKFWTGWEIIPASLSVEVVNGSYPTASTCFDTLRISGHYKDYTSFKNDILGCISTCQTQFGLV
ncbi:uncharacterized protein [Hoplias malabaricus]|uniref:uncharacterized protein isoform X5 n=1 Tax=Hoplias malabaricus TaxID=27720 RepID=UPI0034623C4F